MSGLSLVMFNFFSVNCLGILWWAMASWVVVELCRSRDPRWWLALGFVLGLGFLTKHTIVIWGAGLAVGTLLTPLRHDLTGRWPWLGAAVFLLAAAPNVYWQIANDWPSADFYARRATTDLISPAQVLVQQILINSPATLPVWGMGLYFLLGSRRGRAYRPLGWAFATAFVLAMVAGQPTPYRLAGAYPVALAGGAVLLDLGRKEGAGWLRRVWNTWALPVVIALMGAVVASFALPILPPQQMLEHPLWDGNDGWRVNIGDKRLPYHLGNRTHWRDVVGAVERAHATLTLEERAHAIVLADYFGHAGAVEYYRPDLLPVYSPMTGYYLWGPPPAETETVISIGIDEAFLGRHFRHVETAVRFECALCPAWQDDLPIHVARGPRTSAATMWTDLGGIGGRDLYRRRRSAMEAKVDR